MAYLRTKARSQRFNDDDESPRRPVKMSQPRPQPRDPNKREYHQDNDAHQPRHQRPHEERSEQTERQEKPEQRPVKDMSEFRAEVDAVMKSVEEADSFFDYINSFRELYQKFNEAIKYGPNLLYVFQHQQKARVQNKVFMREQELLARLAEEKLTGDQEFDQFRRDVENHDWYYDFSDSSSVRNNGERRHMVLQDYARSKGGVFLTYWNYRVKKYIDSIKATDNASAEVEYPPFDDLTDDEDIE